MISTNGTTHGTPRSGEQLPRLLLQTNTSTMPPTAVTPIVSTVTPIGGVLSPRACRVARAEQRHAANSGERDGEHDPAERGLMLLLTSL